MRKLWKHLESLHHEAEGTNWREKAEFEPARTPADDEARRKAWAVITPMLGCLWIIIIAGIWGAVT